MIRIVKSDLEALAFLGVRGVYPDRADFQGVLFVGPNGVVGAAGIDRIDRLPDGMPWNATVHSVGEGYWRRYPLKCFFTWLFTECGFRRLTAECLASNTRARAGMKFLGFREEGVRRCAAPDGGDTVILGLLSEECTLVERPFELKEAA